MKKNLQGLITKSIFLCTIVLFLLPYQGKTQSSCQTAVTSRLDSLTQLTINDTVFWLKFTAQSSRLEMLISSLDTIENSEINSIQLYSGNCNQLLLFTEASSNSLFTNSLTQNNEYYLKFNRSITTSVSYFVIAETFVDTTMYSYPWTDSLSCPPSPLGCECIPNNTFSIFTANYGSTIQPFPLNAIWAGKVCGWHALRATPGIIWESIAQASFMAPLEAIWTKPHNLQANTEYFLDVIYANLPSNLSSSKKTYFYITNKNLMSYSTNHNLLIPHIYFPLPLTGDLQLANFNYAGPMQYALITYKQDYRIITIPDSLVNGNIYIFSDSILETRFRRISLKPLQRDTIYQCIGASGNSILNVGSVPNQRVVWHDGLMTNNSTRQVTAPGEYWAIVTHNDSCKVKRHLFIVSDSNIVISGNHNTCDSITNYSITNPVANQIYHWSITPSNTGTITQNNNTNITVRWYSNNMSDSIPSFLNVVNNCGDTIHFKIWKCCNKTPLLFSDSIITANFPNGDVYINGTIIINANITQTNTNFFMGQEAKIIVNPPYTFSFSNRSIEAGCNYMWDGIYLSSSQSSMIIQNAGHINDAFNAIVSENGAPVVVSNTVFNKNLKGIVVKNNTGANNISITNCKFFSATDDSGITPSNLKLPYNNRRGMTGIEINNVANSQIGNPGIAYRNTFSYLDYGIDIDKSNVNIYNNTFANMTEIEEFTGVGIRINGNSSAQQTINIGGYNVGNSVYSNLFNNCNYGVKSLGLVNLNILSDSVTNGYMGFVIDNNTARNIIIRKNKVFMTHMGQGIYMTSIGNSRIFIDSNYVSATSLNTYSGIGVENVMPQVVYGVTIRNNKVVGSFKNGIILTNILKPIIMDPNATERCIPYLYKDSILLSNLLVSMPNTCSAISVSGCTSTVLEENVIVKTDGFTTTTETTALRANGIYISTSTSNQLCNNKITNMGTGIRYNSNCKTATNYQNILTSNYYGFRLDNAAIGNQGSSVPALNRYITYDNQWITDQVVSGRVQGSLSEATKWYYRIGSNYSLTNSQFNITSANFTTYLITPNQTTNCGYDGNIAIDGFGGFMNSMNESFDNESETYVSDIDENQYYDITAAFRKYGNLVIESDDLSNSISENELNPMNIPLFANAANQAAKGLVNEALHTNYNISPVNLVEKNLQVVNQIYLNSWAQGRFNLTDDEYTTLLDIAQQNYISGGYGVFGAEVMTQRFEKNKSDKNQLNYHPILTPNSHENEITLYPNPANGIVYISSLNILDNALFDIFTITGNNILSINTSENIGNLFSLNISGLKQGIYYCRIILSSGKQFNKKLIVY